MKFGGSQSFKTGISVYHIFHEASQFLPEIASNRRKNFRIMMPDVGKRLGGSLFHITLHPTYGASTNPRTNHYIDWFKWTSLKKHVFSVLFLWNMMKYGLVNWPFNQSDELNIRDHPLAAGRPATEGGKPETAASAVGALRSLRGNRFRGNKPKWHSPVRFRRNIPNYIWLWINTY